MLKYLFVCALSWAFVVSLFFTGCHQPELEPAYGIVVYDSVQDANRFIPAVDLKTGLLEGKGVHLPDGLMLTNKGGYFYFLEWPARTLVKYQVHANGLQLQQKLPMSDNHFEAYSGWVVWTGPNQILLGSMEQKIFYYTEIDVAAMKVLRRGKLDVPAPPKDNLNYPSISVQFVRNQLLFFYTFQEGYMREHITPAEDLMYGAVFNYPELKRIKTFQDGRTTWPGSYGIWITNAVADQDTVYVLGQPGGRMAVHPKLRPAVLRVKPGGDAFDPDYFFDLGGNKNEELYSLQAVKNGLAITKVVNTDLVTKFDDYIQRKTSHYELLDLRHQKRIKIPQLKIELDFFKDVVADGDLVYLPVYLNNGNTRFWIYNLKTRSVTEGAEIVGKIIRLDKISVSL